MHLPHPALLPLLFATWAVVTPATAAAQSTPAPAGDVVSYAIVIGSNAGGPGQEDLRFAEDDARRVAGVLRDLGGYARGNVRMVLAPSPAELDAAIARVATQIDRDLAAGRRTLLFFYYSGHARASALVLGDDEVPLTDLRARITGLPSTVTIVVLDACQSGAFTRVKGAEPAADFSFNSRTGLDAAGIAVLASSSESELSQESDFLEGSYFTHHLLVGLRGGGDRDRDGRVSLDEAYQYAYDQTLVATSHTAVGRQHVSLEVDLKGQGDVALTFPAPATATLTLAAAIAGDVLVEQLPAEAVLAEVHKVAGASFDVAIPAGTYRVLVRTATAIHTCPITVGDGDHGAIELAGCDELALADTSAKGDGGAPIGNRWAIDLSFAAAGVVDDAYTARLAEFGYHERDGRTALALGVSRRMMPRLAVTARLTRIAGETWSRDTELEPMELSTVTHALTAGGRGELAFHGDRTILFAEAGLGVTWSRTRFEDELDAVRHDSFLSGHLAGGAGVTRYPPWLGGVGLGLQARYLFAPTVDNLIGDTMNVGGLFVGLSMSYRP